MIKKNLYKNLEIVYTIFFNSKIYKLCNQKFILSLEG